MPSASIKRLLIYPPLFPHDSSLNKAFALKIQFASSFIKEMSEPFLSWDEREMASVKTPVELLNPLEISNRSFPLADLFTLEASFNGCTYMVLYSSTSWVGLKLIIWQSKGIL